MNIPALFERAKVLLKSALAWLTVIAAVLTYVLQQIKDVDGVPPWLLKSLTTVAGVVAIIIVQVRRVTPVSPDQRGLLPPQGPATPTLDAEGEIYQPDAGLTLIELIVGGAVLIVIAYFLLR